MNKKILINIIIILAIIIFSLIVLNSSKGYTEEDLAKCIGKNSELYIQLGCHACSTQEEMFGESYQYLNVIDCWSNENQCDEITYTPTWIIEGEEYIGARSIEELKQLTGC